MNDPKEKTSGELEKYFFNILMDNIPDRIYFKNTKGEYIKIKRLKGFKPPGKDDDYGSLRNLQPFIIDYSKPPRKLIGVLPPRGAALRQLHPENGGAHEQVCDWMDRHPRIKDGKAGRKKRASTKSKNKRKLRLHSVVIIDPPKSYRGDYEVRTRKQKSKATKVEAGLVKSYSRWLKKQGRKLRAITYNGGLQCDRYEEEPRNLIEAKASTSRENIRMAVGQLLDYAFLGKEEINDPNMAILLPEKPDSDLVEWLGYLHIRIIWREKKAFKDNANGWFTSKRENCPAPP